jgi:hypothetical protein
MPSIDYLYVCPYCCRDAELVSGAAVYPHRPDLHHLRFWACLPCDAWVGCHRGTEEPLGRLANAKLRKAKQAAHAAFDPMWTSGDMPRRDAYSWLADALGLDREDTHIGLFDLTMCRRVIEVCRKTMGAEGK